MSRYINERSLRMKLNTIILAILLTTFTLKADYTLQPGDTLEIQLMTKKDLTTKQPITPDGTISLPLIGRTTVQGKTLTELDLYLKDKFTPYIQNPQIVSILTPKEHKATENKTTKPAPNSYIFVALYDISKNTIEVRKTESAAEALAYTATQPFTVTRATQNLGTTTNIQPGDILTITIGKKETFLQKNWYKVLTGTAVGLGIFNTLR